MPKSGLLNGGTAASGGITKVAHYIDLEPVALHRGVDRRGSVAKPMKRNDIETLRAALKPEHRLLGLDVGSKTVGIAISDAARIVASPLRALTRGRSSQDIEAIRQIAESEAIGGLVIGLPVGMDGTEGRQCQRVRAFGELLRPRLLVPIVYWDERLSTAAVERVLIDEADLSRRRRAQVVDKMAAAYILQGALDALARR